MVTIYRPLVAVRNEHMNTAVNKILQRGCAKAAHIGTMRSHRHLLVIRLTHAAESMTSGLLTASMAVLFPKNDSFDAVAMFCMLIMQLSTDEARFSQCNQWLQ